MKIIIILFVILIVVFMWGFIVAMKAIRQMHENMDIMFDHLLDEKEELLNN